MTNVTLVLFFKIAVFSDLWGHNIIVETTNPIFPSLGSSVHNGEGGGGGGGGGGGAGDYSICVRVGADCSADLKQECQD